MTGGPSLQRLARGAEQDVFLLRQRGREVAGAAGLEHQDRVRLATALSEVGRPVRGRGRRADVSFEVADVPPARLVVRMVLASADAGLRDAVRQLPVGRLVDELVVELTTEATIVRMSRRLPGSAPGWTPDRSARARAELAARVPGTPLEELAAQNDQLTAALEEVRRQRDELARLNEELQETNRGVLALYGQLSAELEETNRGVVALYAELDDKTAQLHAASEAKSRFLASVSHELRAPLTAVLGLTRLLTDSASDPLTEEQGVQVELIRSSASDLLTLVNDLLDLAKAESGRLEPHWGEVDLAAVFGQLRGTLRPMVTRPAVELVVEEPTGLPTLRSDGTLLAQVLRNLLTNAIKFTEQGTVTLRAAAPPPGDLVELTVSDTGIGIPADQLDRIFEEFHQVPGPLRGAVPGTGLGLPYARRLVAVLGGELTVASEPGVGSVFTVRLPPRPAGSGPAA